MDLGPHGGYGQTGMRPGGPAPHEVGMGEPMDGLNFDGLDQAILPGPGPVPTGPPGGQPGQPGQAAWYDTDL